MMKKIIIIVFLIIIIAASLLFSPTRNILHISDNAPDARSSVSIPNRNVQKKKTPDAHNAGKAVETAQNNFEIYDQLDKKWLDSVVTIIGNKNFPIYLELRDRNDQEKMQAYKEYHDYLRLKYGDKYTYHISDDQSIREKKINEHYLNELLKIIGEEKFKAYLKMRDDFNEQSRRQSREAMMIEF